MGIINTPANSININSVKQLSNNSINNTINNINNQIDKEYIKDRQNKIDEENSLAKAKQINDKYNTVQLLNNLHNSINQLDQVTDDDNEETIKEKANKIKQLIGQASEVANQYGLTNVSANLLQNGDKEANTYKQDMYNKYSMNLANKIIKNEFVDNINNQEDMYQKAQKVYSYADNISDPEIKVHYLKAVSDLLSGDKDKINDAHQNELAQKSMERQLQLHNIYMQDTEERANKRLQDKINRENQENSNVASFFKNYKLINKDGSIKPIDDVLRDYKKSGNYLDNNSRMLLSQIYNNKLRLFNSGSSNNNNISQQDIKDLTTTKNALYISPKALKEQIINPDGTINKKKYNTLLKNNNTILKSASIDTKLAQDIHVTTNPADPSKKWTVSYNTDKYNANIIKDNILLLINKYNKYLPKDKKLGEEEINNLTKKNKYGISSLDALSFNPNVGSKIHNIISLVQSGKIKRYIQQRQQYLKDLSTSGKTNIKITNLAFKDISEPNKVQVVSNKILQDNWSSLVKGNISENDFLNTLKKHKINSKVINNIKPTLDQMEAIKNFATSAKLKTFNYRYNSKTGLPELTMTLSNDNLKQLAIHYVFDDKSNEVNYKQLKAIKAYLKGAITEMGIPYINGNKIIINSDTLSKMQHALYQYKYRLANKE